MQGWGVDAIHAEDLTWQGVTCVARSHKGAVVVAGDDFGRVSTFHFPCTWSVASTCTRRRGHSTPVASLAFSANDLFVVSVGRDDLALFIWKVVKIPTEKIVRSADITNILQRFQPLPPPKQPPLKLLSDEAFDSVPQWFTGLVPPPDSKNATPLEGLKSLPLQVMQLPLTTVEGTG